MSDDKFIYVTHSQRERPTSGKRHAETCSLVSVQARGLVKGTKEQIERLPVCTWCAKGYK